LSGLARRLQTRLWLPASVVVVCCGLPLLALAGELASEGAAAALWSTLGSAHTLVLLLTTVAHALATTLLALALGVPLGVLLGRCDVVGGRWALWLHFFPLFLPPFLLALGWFHVVGRGGFIGTAWTSGVLFSHVGVIALSTLALSPVVTALTVLGLQGIDPALQESARVVARPLRVVTHILLPLCWPSIALGALIVFALSASEVGLPMFLGVRTYAAAVFTRLGGLVYAPGEAAALSLPLLAIALSLVAVDRRLIGRRAFTALGLRSSQPAPIALGRGRVAVSGAVWLAVAASLSPLWALAARAGLGGLAEVGAWIGDSVITSLWSSALAATLIVLAGMAVGHALARGRGAARPLDTLALVSFMLPSAVLGAGLIATWNRPATRLVYGSLAIVVVGLVARYAALGIRMLAAVFARSSTRYEEAAATFGAGYSRRMTRIVAPMHARGIAGAWLVTMVFGLRDLDTLVVFYPPGLEPLIVRIFTLEANGPPQVVAALAVVHVGLTAALLLAGGRLLWWRGRVA
jgi:iron(III) transport system permease protein